MASVCMSVCLSVSNFTLKKESRGRPPSPGRTRSELTEQISNRWTGHKTTSVFKQWTEKYEKVGCQMSNHSCRSPYTQEFRHSSLLQTWNCVPSCSVLSCTLNAIMCHCAISQQPGGLRLRTRCYQRWPRKKLSNVLQADLQRLDDVRAQFPEALENNHTTVASIYIASIEFSRLTVPTDDLKSIATEWFAEKQHIS